MYEFRCAGGHEFTELVKTDTAEMPCKYCERVAKRQMSAPSLKSDGAYSYGSGK